ncbi:GAF domain-containing protein [Gluconacetobacter sp. Hr-1-5]|uniref:GAF domain-containing protein n=1 Tax=Gluconacetobacter sp. Hr-1-5 TaxID=3395370 RepID=UPI003B521505
MNEQKTDVIAAADVLLPPAVMRVLDDAQRRFAEILPFRTFTVLVLDEARGLNRRIYSNVPHMYPVGGAKPIPHTAWFDIVVGRREPFVAGDVAGFAPHYGDWAYLESHGLLSALNLPIVVDDRCVGSFNFMGEGEDIFTPAMVSAAMACAADLGPTLNGIEAYV